MALVLVVEDGTGLTTANSYATVAEANTYHEGRLHNLAWQNDYDDDTKAAALVWATRLLDQLRWEGNRMTTTQALRWPRGNVLDRERDALLDDDEIPAWLKDATAELAARLVEEDRTKLADDQIISGKTTQATSALMWPRDRRATASIPSAVLNLIQPYIVQGSARLVRV